MDQATVSTITEFMTLPVVLAMPRVLTAIYMIGILPKGIPIHARGSLAIVIGLFAQPIVADQIYAIQDPSPEIYGVIVLKEALIGIMIGMSYALVLRILDTAGGVLDFQSGASNASIMDPVTNTETGPYGRLLVQIGIVLLLASGGFLSMIRTLAESFKVWPVTSFFPKVGDALLAFVMDYIQTLFLMAIVVGMSIGILLLVIELGIGFINRITPQLNVFTFAMGIKSLLVIVVLIAALPFLYDGFKDHFSGTHAFAKRFYQAFDGR